MKHALYCFLILSCELLMALKEPSTTITSDRMEMLRFKSHNEFTFQGNVVLKGKVFSGSCEFMWVYTEMVTHPVVPLWYFLCPLKETPVEYHCWVQTCKKKEQENSGIGQIKRIVAQRNVYLKTEDPVTGEVKQSNSGKAVIYPREGKMVLTENPVVRCSLQGTFRGGKITFFRASDRILVENSKVGQRSTVTLGE